MPIGARKITENPIKWNIAAEYGMAMSEFIHFKNFVIAKSHVYISDEKRKYTKTPPNANKRYAAIFDT